jgi:histidine kinase
MSIRKRLFLSNAAMVVTPIIIFLLVMIFFGVAFRDEFQGSNNGFHPWWNNNAQNVQEPPLYTRLKRMASLNPEKLTTPAYLNSLNQQLKDRHAETVIRKGNKIVFKSIGLEDISNLPAFGNEGFSQATRISNHFYSLRQHDFYFKDGTPGSIFYITKTVSIVNFARTFFPLLFLGIIIILVLTNVLLSYFVSRSILRPVNQLSAAASKISVGNLDFNITPTRNDELGNLVKTFEDMRARLKGLMELRDQYENNRRELVANISHDLKTPLTSIRGYVEGIQDGVANTEEKKNKYLETIQTKVQYMDHLIDELLLYSKLDVKRLPFHFETVSLRAFLEDFLDEVNLEYRKKHVELTLHAPQDFHSNVLIDRGNIIRVLNNIIHNSMKYNDKEICHIEIHLKDLGKWVEVRIKDNGPGVSSVELDRIFKRFYRVDPARNTRTGGSGLGLAICAQIIEAHGGTIQAENSINGGLIISFTLQKPDEKGA